MKIDIALFPTKDPVDITAVAKRVEELGFDSLWVSEHLIMLVHGTSKFPGLTRGGILAPIGL